MRVLVIRAIDSPPTTITSFFGAKIANFLREKGFDVVEVVDYLNSSKLGWWLLGKNYDLILYLGHGEKDRLLGNIYLGILLPFLSLSNINNIRNKVTITYACLSAQILGTKASSVAKAYTGSDYFMYIAYPEEIDYTQYFYEPFFEMIRAFINGRTIGESVEIYKRIALDNARKLRALPDSSAKDYAMYLELNAKHYQVLGNEEATL